MAAISVITTTYNRAHLLPRAIGSVLAQTYHDWELLIVDDGSTDDTFSVLSSYKDPRIRIITHGQNRGVTSAKNTGFEHMTGEWFTFLDSDDEMVPYALEKMLQIPDEIDSSVNAVTCNCIDSSTGEFAGHGLHQDMYLDFETMVANCSGEHWGITHRSLLGTQRFNEKINGGESVLWYRISRHARRYYINQGLRIYHTEGIDRISQRATSKDIKKRCVFYREISKEYDYLEILKFYRPADYSAVLFRIAISSILEGDMKEAQRVISEGKAIWTARQAISLNLGFIMGPSILQRLAPYILGGR